MENFISFQEELRVITALALPRDLGFHLSPSPFWKVLQYLCLQSCPLVSPQNLQG